ncbi:hypothetical protein [Aerosakkonema funiforme]|uniref:Uncharacterized protein n=1 Tax=Aerosakkonema funiforme FACHB-1375 TaxID=2949571 RepID=A0A926ZL94_9CYAN|nr:hypothetical protein [Aerosakkonema funiforme]MBD2184851.1 hypothetical protein [Aerosakkonema funiforme FACHB-1375]
MTKRAVIREKRMAFDRSELFDTQFYLATNPDVAKAVGAGLFTSAFQH